MIEFGVKDWLEDSARSAPRTQLHFSRTRTQFVMSRSPLSTSSHEQQQVKCINFGGDSNHVVFASVATRRNSSEIAIAHLFGQ